MGCTMESRKADVVGFLKNLKGAQIRFNPKPFSNPIHLQNKIIRLEKQQLAFEQQNFIDHHAEVVNKVDALIAQMQQIEQMQPLETPITSEDEIDFNTTVKMDLSPDKINSDL